VVFAKQETICRSRLSNFFFTTKSPN